MGTRRATMLVAALLWALPSAGQGLSYVEASSGLEQPEMENGETELEVGDVNSDGHPDLVSVGDHGSPWVNSDQHGLMVWLGNGAGAWSVRQSGEFGYGGVALGDVNGDGLLDAAYGVHHAWADVDLGDQLLEVVLGNGSGEAWQPWDDGLASNGEDWGMFGTDLADVDNDGDLDLGSNSFGCCDGVHVYLNQGDGTWSQSFGFIGGSSGKQLVFGELDGDGHADLVVAGRDRTVFMGDGAGGFTPGDDGLPVWDHRSRIAVGDVTGDGRDDLAITSDAGVGVFSLDATGSWIDLSGDLAAIGRPELVQLADMDLDGLGDVVVLFPGRVEVFAGDGLGGWTLVADVVTAPSSDCAALHAGHDLDHNGRPDMVYVCDDARGFFGPINAPHVVLEDSVAGATSLHVVSPRGGETWVAGSVRFIDWHAAVPPGQPLPELTITLSLDGGDGPSPEIVRAFPAGGGRYQWRLPPDLPTSSRCLLRLALDSDPPVEAFTPACFTIVNPESPELPDEDSAEPCGPPPPLRYPSGRVRP